MREIRRIAGGHSPARTRHDRRHQRAHPASGRKHRFDHNRRLSRSAEIGRQIRPKMYNLKADEPPPLVPREHRFEVSERIGADGQVVVDLTDKEINDVIEKSGRPAQACAIGFLFAFLNADHEDRIAAAIKAALPGVHLSPSSGVQPEFREYERLSTTVLNAYLQPAVTRYMESLKVILTERASSRLSGSINPPAG